jgi:hypothetical protein
MTKTEAQTTALTWRFVRPGLHVNDATGLELRRGCDEEIGIEWQIWTRGMDRALGTRNTLGAAKRRAAEIVNQHKEWL